MFGLDVSSALPLKERIKKKKVGGKRRVTTENNYFQIFTRIRSYARFADILRFNDLKWSASVSLSVLNQLNTRARFDTEVKLRSMKTI